MRNASFLFLLLTRRSLFRFSLIQPIPHLAVSCSHPTIILHDLQTHRLAYHYLARVPEPSNGARPYATCYVHHMYEDHSSSFSSSLAEAPLVLLSSNQLVTLPSFAATPPSSSTTFEPTASPIAFLLASLNPSNAAFAPPPSMLSRAIRTPSFQSFALPATCRRAAALSRT